MTKPQWCCEHNILFTALSCGSVPHFTTLAHFVSRYTEEVEALFEQILLVCDEQGLLGNELFAIDGCKLPSNAAKAWSGTFKELEEKRDKLKRQIRHHMDEPQRLDNGESREEERLATKRTCTTCMKMKLMPISQTTNSAAGIQNLPSKRKNMASGTKRIKSPTQIPTPTRQVTSSLIQPTKAAPARQVKP
jgi:hypothetical protein